MPSTVIPVATTSMAEDRFVRVAVFAGSVRS